MHALGNPHFLIDPRQRQADRPRRSPTTSRRWIRQTPSLFKANLQTFNATLDAKLADWQKQLAPYRGAKIVTYHKDFVYLAERFNLEIVETLEPKPGIAPSPGASGEGDRER